MTKNPQATIPQKRQKLLQRATHESVLMLAPAEMRHRPLMPRSRRSSGKVPPHPMRCWLLRSRSLRRWPSGRVLVRSVTLPCRVNRRNWTELTTTPHRKCVSDAKRPPQIQSGARKRRRPATRSTQRQRTIAILSVCHRRRRNPRRKRPRNRRQRRRSRSQRRTKSLPMPASIGDCCPAMTKTVTRSKPPMRA